MDLWGGGSRSFLFRLLPHVTERSVGIDLLENNARAAGQVDEHAVTSVVPAFRTSEKFSISVITLVAIELLPVSVQNNLVLARELNANLVIRVAVAVVEVEREHEVVLLEHGDLIRLMGQANVLVL